MAPTKQPYCDTGTGKCIQMFEFKQRRPETLAINISQRVYGIL